MLQQILVDMYIDPELLAVLNEEQKQTLFFKMREEQVRRWKEREAELLKKEAAAQKPARKATGKQVSWLPASDGDVWVWVMGEHPSDKPYEQICDEIIAERAKQQAQSEAEQLRAKKEQELVRRFSKIYTSPKVVLQRQEAAAEQRRVEEELKRKELEERQKAEEEVQRLAKERAEQIYMNMKVHQDVYMQEKEDQEWQDTLRRSKAEDQRRRSLAKQTREDHKRRSLKALEQGRVAAVAKAFQGGKKLAPAPKPKPRTIKNEALTRRIAIRRTPSVSNRDEITRWFQEEQLPLRAGFEKDQSAIAPWFHGIITRQEAEALLNNKKPGSFLISVSEKVMGYSLFCQGQEGCKHFIIDATDNCYMLLGDLIKFTTLKELVDYHEVEPITTSGGEQLLYPCGQRTASLDYADLFT